MEEVVEQALHLARLLDVLLSRLVLRRRETCVVYMLIHCSLLKCNVDWLRGLKTLLALDLTTQNLVTACKENCVCTQFEDQCEV